PLAATGSARVWIGRCVDDPFDTGGDQGIGAGRRPSVVGAWLLRNENVRSFRFLTCLAQGDCFCMGPTRMVRMTSAYGHHALDDHGADARIGSGVSPERNLDGPTHGMPVALREPGVKTAFWHGPSMSLRQALSCCARSRRGLASESV